MQPGSDSYISVIADLGDSIAGSFQETSGSKVSFYILTTAGFQRFEGGLGMISLYRVENVSFANFSFMFPGTDTYYLIFRHGPGFESNLETLSFQRTYTLYDWFRIILGALFLIFGITELVILRSRGPKEPGLVGYPPSPLVLCGRCLPRLLLNFEVEPAAFAAASTGITQSSVQHVGPAWRSRSRSWKK